MKMKIVVLMAAAISASGCTTLERSRSLADPKTPAKAIAQQVCSNCHGIDGNSVSPNFPRLAAQQKDYFIAQLKEFRSHDRLDPAGFEYMWGLSRSLTDAQIEGLADYFAAQKPTPPKVRVAANFAAGREVFRKGVPAQNIPPCATCHGDEAQGNAAFPRLAFQHADYVYKQLMVFQRTDERPQGAVMKTIAHGLTPQDMAAVATFVQSFAKD